MLITSFRLPKLLILLVVSCLSWVGLFWLAIQICTMVSIGWILCGAVILALSVWLVVMFREIREHLFMRITGIFRVARTR